MRINNYVWENDLSLNDLVLQQKEKIEKLQNQLQQKENIIKEVRKKLIKSKEYQAVKSLGFNSKMSVLIELEELLESQV